MRLLSLIKQHPFKIHKKGILLITGASSGIGRHAAQYIASGHSEYLVLAGVRKESDAEAIRCLEIKNLQPTILDVTSPSSCERVLGDIRAVMEKNNLPFVGLVNNAGVCRTMPFEFHTVEDARNVFDVNVFGVMNITQTLLPLLRASQGRIVMISSICGFIGMPVSAVYAASKFALEGMSDSLRRECFSLVFLFHSFSLDM